MPMGGGALACFERTPNADLVSGLVSRSLSAEELALSICTRSLGSPRTRRCGSTGAVRTRPARPMTIRRGVRRVGAETHRATPVPGFRRAVCRSGTSRALATMRGGACSASAIALRSTTARGVI